MDPFAQTDEQDHSAYLNPDYGNGVFRRKIRLTATANTVVGELEDCAHGFRCRLEHDGQVLTHIVGESLRTPYDICTGATEPIKQFIGKPIDISLVALNQEVNARSNCTHLYDLSALALEFCYLSSTQGMTERVIDVFIPDENKDAVTARVLIDGEEILAWQLQSWQIVGPKAIAGKPMHRGFAAWVNEMFSGLQNTAAFVLQKSYLVGEARRYDIDAVAGQTAVTDNKMLGICYTYSEQHIGQGKRLAGTMRDFTDCEEQLLQFR